MASKSSEFGGVAGRVAPLPHDLSAAERWRLERATNPTDPTADAETQRIAEGNVGPVDVKGNLP